MSNPLHTYKRSQTAPALRDTLQPLLDANRTQSDDLDRITEGDELSSEPRSASLKRRSLNVIDEQRYPSLRHFPRSFALDFNGNGECLPREWNLSRLADWDQSFSWHHVEIPRNLSSLGQPLLEVLHPLKLHETLPLLSSGPFCGIRDGALVFRINSVGPLNSNFTSKLAALVTPRSVVSLSLGDIARIQLDPADERSILAMASAEEHQHVGAQGKILDFLLSLSHPEDVEDQKIPSTVPELIVHILQSYQDHLRDMVTNFEVELDYLDQEIDSDDQIKAQLLENRRLSKMALDLQRVLQVTTYGEEIMPAIQEKLQQAHSVTDKCAKLFESLAKRTKTKKTRIQIIGARIDALQNSLKSWQADQLNEKVYYLTVVTIIFSPLAVITGAFGMNVSGVLWTPIEDGPGFRNVMIVCACVTAVVLTYFFVPPIYFWFQKRRKHKRVVGRWQSAISHSIPNKRRGSTMTKVV